MTHLADRTRLFKQALILLRVGAGKMKGLDRHLALQVRIASKIDDALSAPSQFSQYLEAADLLAHCFVCTSGFWS